jgi:hypothetical protein
MPMAVLRVVIVVVAVGAIVLVGTRLRDHDRCQSAQTAIAASGPRGGEIAKLSASCRDPDVIAGVSALLLVAGARQPGTALAREAVQREPASFIGWVALAQGLGATDPAGARAAVRRARALNPRWPGPASASTPRSP